MTEQLLRLPLDGAIVTAIKAFRSIGFSEQQAFDVTRQLVYGEIRGGKRNHGLDRFPWIMKQKNKSFFFDREVIVDYENSNSSIIILDGQHGVGYSQVYEAVICATECMKYKDALTIGLKNAYPTNCLGDYSTILANQGYASYIGSLSPDKVAFPGGNTAVLPTSGQAFGMPGNPPMALDFSIGAVTNGDLAYCKKHQLPLPPDACVNSEGEVTTDVNDVLDDNGNLTGSILPRGGQSASFIMASFGVMLMMHGIEVGIEPGKRGTFMNLRRVGKSVHEHWDKLFNKLLSKDGKSMIPGHRGMRMANESITTNSLQIDKKKWHPINEAAQNAIAQSYNVSLDKQAEMMLSQLQDGYYASLDKSSENKYEEIFNKYNF